MAISLGGFSGGGAGAVTSVNGQTGVVVVSGDDVAADHTASNYTAANANIDGHLSGIDTKFGTLAAGLTYKGAFNATAGTPSIANALQGDLYVIDTAGTIYGQTWAIGDHLLINANMGGVIDNAKIDKVDNTDQVTSVNGSTGAITLSGDDLTADHTASNYTAANANIDGHLSGIDSKFGTLATVATTGAYSDLSGTPTLATVATTGAYSDLSGTPSLATVATTGAYSDLSGTPTLGTASAAATTDFLASTAGLDDLSDVSYTGSSSINNYVLTYNHSSTSWGAAVVPSAPVTSVNGSTGAITLSGDDLTADHTASNYTAANANVDGHLSGIDTKLGTLGTASTAASTDFLSATGADTLGGNLDVGSSDIVSSSNANIELAPDGTGKVTIKGNATGGSGAIVLNCENNSHGITLAGPAHSAAASYKLIYPTTVGTAGQVLKTDGGDGGSPNTVQLDWVTQSGGGGWTYSAITADPANAQAGYHYSCGAGNQTFTVTLPTSGVSSGEEIRIKNMGTGTITIDPQTQNIDGSTTDLVLDIQFASVTLVSTGSHWEVI